MIFAVLVHKPNDSIKSYFENNFKKCCFFNDISELISSNDAYGAVIIINFSMRNTDIIKKLRHSNHLYNIPVFTDDKKIPKYISDGYCFDSNLIYKTVNAINMLFMDLKNSNINEVVNWKRKLLTYLYCRPELTLSPDMDKYHHMFYFYPLVKLFYEGNENYFYWLDELLDQRLLTNNKLIDRLFCCPFCFSAHLKFTDHCPYCNSINIRHGDFLHCFSCGLVAPQEDFLKRDRLICPRCNAHLLHIGEDYDRPLESGVCMDCGEYHIDAKVVAYCVECKKSVTTDRLNKKNVYEFLLSDLGRTQVKFNTIDVVPVFKDSINYIALNYFYEYFNWFIKMQERYKEENFSILIMKVIFSDSVDHYELYVELGKLLRKVFRTTDLCTRSSNGDFWFLLPKTKDKDMNIIKARIEKFSEDIKHDEDEIDSFVVKLIGFTSNYENTKGKNAKILISELSGQL